MNDSGHNTGHYTTAPRTRRSKGVGINTRRSMVAVLVGAVSLSGMGLAPVGADEHIACPEAPEGMNVIVSDAKHIKGTQGDDFICAGPSKNIILGRGGNDIIFGGAGNDVIMGRSGDDHIFGGEGNDKIRGGSGDDVVEGGEGDDKINGGSGDDVLSGGDGDDKVSGRRGNDQLFGDADTDRARGGSGVDTCTSAEKNKGCEEIADEPKEKTKETIEDHTDLSDDDGYDDNTSATPNRAPRLFVDENGYAVDEHSPAGTVLDNDEVSAIDPDGDADLSFSITGGTGEALFSVDPESGMLTVKPSEAILDFEVNSSYTLSVTVSDGELSDTKTTTVAINDVNEAPVLLVDSDDYSIDEFSDGGTELEGEPVSAIDQDANSTAIFSITGGTGEGMFEVDPSSGVLRVMESEATINYDYHQFFTLTITAFDGELSSSETVTIEVNDLAHEGQSAESPDDDDDDDDDDELYT